MRATEFELTGRTAAGARLVDLAEKHAEDAGRAAAEHDAAGTVPTGTWTAMARSGFLAGSAPERFGGLGVTSVHDLAVAVGRLGRGDGSTAIGAAMHLTALWFVARQHAAAPAGPGVGKGLELMLRACGRGRLVACVALSERGATLGRPQTVAEPTPEGYRITGRKAFCTNSPVATVFLATVRLPGGPGPDRLGFALLPRGLPGLRVLDTWDALGMRCSGSGDLELDGCSVDAAMVRSVGDLGRLSDELLPLAVVGALVLGAAFLGIGEQAQALALDAVRRRRDPQGPVPAERATVQALIAENDIAIASGRALLGRTAALVDELLAAPDGDRDGDGDRGPERPGPGPADLMHQVQCTTAAVKRDAVACVDRALTLTGGAGYLNAHPLSRLYRDVRAGPFMQPFSALDVGEYIGRVRLGLSTELDGQPPRVGADPILRPGEVTGPCP